MNTMAISGTVRSFPLQISMRPQLAHRNRLTAAFRIFLALPHLMLVGGPVALILAWRWDAQAGANLEWAAGGVLGTAAIVCAIIAWFAIVFTGKHPQGLRHFAMYYLRWRVRAVAYTALLCDEYPPFEDADYPFELTMDEPRGPRDRVGVAFRCLLVIPQVLCVWALGAAWFFVSCVAWFSILFVGRYPRPLYDFACGVLLWTTRVEAYVLLLEDVYPPFALH